MGHNHENNTSNRANKRTLTISLILISSYMIVEVIGGLLTNSLALLADAGHMLSDAISLFIALMAFTYSNKVANYRKTYGYKRFEILAAVFNGATLIGISVYIIYKAIGRFQNPAEIASDGMLLIAFIGLLVNILVAWIMFRGSDVKNNLNMRGAFLHVISDMFGSAGAIIAALLIMYLGWNWADPMASILVSLLILRSGYSVTKSSVNVLMEGTPENVNTEKVIEKILQTDGIYSIHDLHIWSITSGLNALTCHAVVDKKLNVEESETMLFEIETVLKELNIHHATIQLESQAHPHSDSILCNAKTETTFHDSHVH